MKKKEMKTMDDSINDAEVGDDIICHNKDNSIRCILRVISKESEYKRK